MNSSTMICAPGMQELAAMLQSELKAANKEGLRVVSSETVKDDGMIFMILIFERGLK